MSNSQQWVETTLELQQIILDYIQVNNAIKLQPDKKKARQLRKRRVALCEDMLYYSRILEELKGKTAAWAINHWRRILS